MAEKNKRIVKIQEKLGRGMDALKKEIRDKIREYYQENPEKAKERRTKRRKIFRRFLIFRKGFRTREQAMAESMAKLISDMDQKNEELAVRTTNMMRLSNLKIRIAREYAELNKGKLLVLLTVVLMIATAVAAGINSITGYEYSYNGRVLGVVKEQEDVLKILDVVQEQLSKEHNAQVAIDRNLDIHFERVIALNREIDESEEVLRQLTYMQDMKIKAVALYINGNREAILSSEEDAGKILEAVQASFLSNSPNTEYEQIGFAEAVEIKEIDTKLGRIMNFDDTFSKIMTGAIAKRTHEVVSGDTFSGIAKRYSISSSDLRMANPGINPERLSIGQEIILTQTVPLLTVQTVEVATYIEPIPFETVQNETSSMYKGEQSIRVQGENGERSVVARIIKNNGVEISKTELSSTVIKNPVDKVVNVGTKPPPALQGTGSFIYPVTGARLTTRYSRYHQAIDLAISSGTKIRASDGGTVISSGYSGSYGYVVRINHGGNRVTLYAHCSKLLVKAGDKVYQGQHIANVGSTGRSTGPHVHFEVIINGVKRNPLDYL
jgi:murein DD-endopeptidase MepM/ murein hydrolase activator NlpD